MYKKFLLLMGTASALASCSKTEPQNPESVFYLGNLEVKTNDFRAYCINGKTKLRYAGYASTGQSLAFGIGFHYGDFPYKDSMEVSYDGVYTSQCNIGFILDGTQYLVDRNNNTYLYASTYRVEKYKYVLGPTWFYSQIPDSNSNGFIRGNDSILVQGTFYESNDVVIR